MLMKLVDYLATTTVVAFRQRRVDALARPFIRVRVYFRGRKPATETKPPIGKSRDLRLKRLR